MWLFRLQKLLIKLKTEERYKKTKKNMNTLEVLEYYNRIANKLSCLRQFDILQELPYNSPLNWRPYIVVVFAKV